MGINIQLRRLFFCFLLLTIIHLHLTGNSWGASEATGSGEESGSGDSGAVSIPSSSHCSENTRFGPLQLRGQSAFQLLRLSLIPLGVESIPRGHWQLNTTATWSNRWARKEGKYLLDAEILRIAAAVTYGATDWMQLRVEIPMCLRGGGYMDGFILGFHDTFGLGQLGRDDFPKDQFQMLLWRKDGSIFTLNESNKSAGLEDIVLSTTFSLVKGQGRFPKACLTLHLKVPTGDKEELFGSGSLDGGIAVCLAKRIGKVYGYLGLQYTRFGGNEIAGISMQDYQLSMFTAVELPITARWSFLLQELFNSGAAENFYEFSEMTNEITLGLKGKVMEKTLLEIGFIENLFKFDNSPDFGFHLGLSRMF